MELWWRKQERDQVGHLLDSNGGFQAFRHQRKAGARNLRDVAAEHRLGHALGALECEACGAFPGDDAVQRAAVFRLDAVAEEVRRDLAIRIKDVAEDLLGIPLANGGEVRANVLANIANAMAGSTGGLENFLAATRVALHREGGLIFQDDFLALGKRGIAE